MSMFTNDPRLATAHAKRDQAFAAFNKCPTSADFAKQYRDACYDYLRVIADIRADRARNALLKYMELDPLSVPANILDECTLSDFLADTLHLFGRSEVRKALTLAERYYSHEQKKPHGT